MESASNEDRIDQLKKDRALLLSNFRRGIRNTKLSGISYPEPSSASSCYNCDKFGHYAAECGQELAINISSSKSYSNVKKDSKFKSNCRMMKEFTKGGEKESRGLVAEKASISDSETSSSDEEMICLDSGLCLMADDAESSTRSEVAGESSASCWNPDTLKKVHKFRNYSSSEKDSVIECLIMDLTKSYDIQNELKDELAELKINVVDQRENVLIIESLKNDLNQQILENQLCITEQIKSETNLINLKKIMDSWFSSSQKLNRCISEQIPRNKKAILGGDKESAASIADSTSIDPIFNITEKFSEVSFNPISVIRDPKPNRFVRASGVTDDIFLGITDDKLISSQVEFIDSSSLAGSSLTASLMQDNHFASSSIAGNLLSHSDLKKSSSDIKEKAKVSDTSILPLPASSKQLSPLHLIGRITNTLNQKQ